jgi:hypothetical protein
MGKNSRSGGGYGHLTISKNLPHSNATRVFVNWLLGRDGQEIFRRAMGVASRRLDIDTRWLKEFGVIGAKDGLTLDQIFQAGKSIGRKDLQAARAGRSRCPQAAGGMRGIRVME